MFLQFVSRLATAKNNALGNLCLTEAISSFSANPVFRNRFNWLRIIFLDGVAIVRLLSRVWSDGRDRNWLASRPSFVSTFYAAPYTTWRVALQDNLPICRKISADWNYFVDRPLIRAYNANILCVVSCQPQDKIVRSILW